MRYRVQAADELPYPRASPGEPRHLGWRGEELTRPFIGFAAANTLPPLPHTLAAGRVDAARGYEVDDVAARLARPGDDRFEDGWTVTAAGTTVIACRTPMPGVTAAMWDWWFGWHLPDPARYRLWHPNAHRHAAVADDRSRRAELSDRQRYVGNVSFVEEFLGDTVHRLAIRFVAPSVLGFEDRPGWTHVCARTGLAEVPIALGWLVHQVRPTDDGCEMRSRFFLDRPAVLPLPAAASARPRTAAVLRAPVVRSVTARVAPVVARRVVDEAFARDLYRHCAQEMHHLASFLPELSEAMRDHP